MHFLIAARIRDINVCVIYSNKCFGAKFLPLQFMFYKQNLLTATKVDNDFKSVHKGGEIQVFSLL
jgi:hypothetical protein